MGESLRFGKDEEENDELAGGEHTAESDALPEFATEASTSGEANPGEARSHSNFGIEEVRSYSQRIFFRDMKATFLPMAFLGILIQC